MPRKLEKTGTQIATHIDLFAGCGGFSLGLEKAGFRPVFVSELNEHALQTYLINRESFGLRPEIDTCNDIRSLTAKHNRAKLESLTKRLRSDWGDITLVAGGPPCQGYSTRGIRTTFKSIERNQTPSNHLYKEMAKFVEAIGPKFFIFENVAGLRTAKWTKNGEKGEILSDIQSTFTKIRTWNKKRSYKTHLVVIRCKDYGIPQNRPRLFIIGVREDVTFDSKQSLVADGLFPNPSNRPAPHPEDLLGDLIHKRGERLGSTSVYPSDPKTAVQRELRRSQHGGQVLQKGEPLTEQDYTNHSERVTKRFQMLIDDPDGLRTSMKIKKFSQRALPRRWGIDGPSITATSAPDDYVHYSRPRILTVREWARLQLFPDWYQFCGPRTTGGRRRAGDPANGIWDRELPKYTQIGNAVPVLLAEQIGTHLIAISKPNKR